MDALLIGLAGGAIGTLLLWSGRLLAVPLEIEVHDRRLREIDEDLALWVADEHVRLKREVHKLVNELNARNLFYSGELGYQVGVAKETALRGYRDRERTAVQASAAVREQESWPHLLWRRVRHQTSPELKTPQLARPVLDLWRAPVTRHLSPTDTPRELDDPTRLTIDDAVSDAEQNPTSLT